MRSIASFLTLGIAFLLVSQPVHAESGDHEGESKDQSKQTSTDRPDGDSTVLKAKEANLLSAVFRLPVPVVNDLYGESIPKALTKAITTKDETEISVILADLMGTLNNKQMDTLVSTVESEITEEKEKENRDKRYIGLLERLFWAGRIMQGDPIKNESSQEYNKSFNEAFAKRREKSELIHQKIQDALAGNEQAKQFLRDNLNRRSVLAFIDAQRKSGNTKLANDLLDALSTKDGNDKVLDTFAGGESQRLKLGPTRSSMEDAIQAYSDRNGGLHNVALASKNHERPRRVFKVGANGTNLDVTENKPRPRVSVAGGSEPETKAQPKRPAAEGGQKTAGPAKKTPPPKTAPKKPASSGESIAGVQSLVSASCQGCHATRVTGSSTRNARIIVDEYSGQPKTLAQAVAKMKSSGSMSGLASEIGKLTAFARK